jgi:hypothetical protein
MPRFQIKSILIAVIAVGLVACATSPVNDDASRFDEALESINLDLADPAFQAGVVSKFEKAGFCKATYKGTWAQANSTAKGFAAVETAVLVDFSANVERAEYIAAYDDTKPDHIERWADSIRVDFTKPVPGVFKSMPIGETQMSTREYAPDLISLGVANSATEQNVARFVQELNWIVRLCHKASVAASNNASEREHGR